MEEQGVSGFGVSITMAGFQCGCGPGVRILMCSPLCRVGGFVVICLLYGLFVLQHTLDGTRGCDGGS